MAKKPAPRGDFWTAEELMKLPRAEWDEILSEMAAFAEEEYRTNKDLTDFEAFGENDLFGESTAFQLEDDCEQ